MNAGCSERSITNITMKCESLCHYFVDEAGDAVIFGKKKKFMVGKQNCPRFFSLGLLQVESPTELSRELEELRSRILADPELNHLPGVDPSYQKTSVYFHACNDHPIIRRIVYDYILSKTGLHFYCVVKDKLKVYEYIQGRQEFDPKYRYNHGELYDYCVRRLFKPHLHEHTKYYITFASWIQSHRKQEMVHALATARERYSSEHPDSQRSSIVFQSRLPKGIGGLQIADYYLWALQRVYEIQDASYFNLISKKYSLIVDIDDQRKRVYGEYYSWEKNPLTLEKVSGRL